MGSEISLPSSKAVPLCCGSSFMHSYERTGSCDLLAEMCPEHRSQVPVSGRAANALKRLRVHCHRAVSFLLLVLSNLSSTDSCLRGDALLYLWGFLHTDYQEPRKGMTSQELHTFLLTRETNCVSAVNWAKQLKQMGVFLKLQVAQVNNQPPLTCSLPWVHSQQHLSLVFSGSLRLQRHLIPSTANNCSLGPPVWKCLFFTFHLFSQTKNS